MRLAIVVQRYGTDITPIIDEQKYVDTLARLNPEESPRPRLEALPGRWRRHRATLPRAAELVRRLPRSQSRPRRMRSC